MKTRASVALCTAVLLGSPVISRADLARLPGADLVANAKPSSGSNAHLTRLAPSYTRSFLATVGTEQSLEILAAQAAGAVHLTSDQIFYAPLSVVEPVPGSGMGPGGDDSVDPNPPPPPESPVKVPAPSALGLGIVGMVFFSRWRRRME